jgi:hypothetical protein
MLAQLSELQVPELTASLAGTTVKLKAPMVFKDLAALSAPTTAPAQAASATATINAGLTGNGDIAQIMALLDVLGGQKPQLIYFGKFEFDQNVTSARGVMKAEGQAVVRSFEVHDVEGKTTFSEPVIRVVNNITTDDQKQLLSLDKMSLAMESSKALAVDLTGKIADYKAARRFEGQGLVATLTYDLAQLWPILQPYTKPVPDPATGKTPEDYYAGLTIAGKYTKQFAVTGSFPADGPAGMAGMKTMNATGGFTMDQLVMPKMGLTMGKADLNVAMEKGIVRLLNPPPIPTNGGKLNLAKDGKSFELDLTGDHPRLSAPADLLVLENISANPVFANLLGDYVNNPLLLTPRDAAGAVNLRLKELTRLPVDKRVLDYDPSNDGRMIADLSVEKIQLGNATVMQVISFAKTAGLNDDPEKWFQGTIRNYRVQIEKGVVSHKMDLELTESASPLQMYGDVRMQDRMLMPLTLFFPKELFGRSKLPLPRGLALPLFGPATAPQFDFGKAVQQNVVGQFLDPATIGDLFGPKKKNDPKNPATSQPAQQDPLGGLLDLFNKPKKDDKKKEK